MKEKIAWVTDTSAMLDEEFIDQHNIFVLPIVVIFEDRAYRETVDLSLEEFYEKLKNTKKIPTTSQPVIGESIDLYKNLKAEGYTCAITIHTPSKLSNTYDSSYTAAQQAGLKVYPIDSKAISYPMKKLIERGIELEQAGYDADTIVNTLQKTTENIFLTGVHPNLNRPPKKRSCAECCSSYRKYSTTKTNIIL
ncbi:DegV family protein with EDD domain OS=Ureibacillus acetophenoni OX=614649 GN=SAMN05877842_10259 PE=4 SV=1 [Ureibacillus acetophenoni]